MTLIEKILAKHAGIKHTKPGYIVDITIDARAARDFGGANVVKNLLDNSLTIDDSKKTYFTFDCNPGGSDQKYAANQHFCRQYARQEDISVYDVNAGIGTHIAIEQGLVFPGSTFVSTDSHANIQGAVGAFGQGMGDKDIAATFANGKIWFKVPKSAKLTFKGKLPENVTAKDIVLNLLSEFGANTLLGYSVELYGEAIDQLTLDQRITIASMATEMGAIILLFPPNTHVLNHYKSLGQNDIEPIYADRNATYSLTKEVDISKFKPMVSRPGHPEDTIAISDAGKRKIDSAFIGSCTNGRIEDLRAAAEILKQKPIAPGVVLKIVPATDMVWKQALEEGLIAIFKNAGALVSNAGCAGCAAGQVGQNGPGEVTISTGNRNFAGKQGKGEVYLASPETVAASAVAGYITSKNDIPEKPAVFKKQNMTNYTPKKQNETDTTKKIEIEGKVWFIPKDNIDTDMIFHNRYLTITDINEMGQYTFDNLEGYEDFATKAQPNDIIITTKNFGAGSSRQQAVDCFKSLSIQCIVAESYGAIYERNAINAGFPVLTYNSIQELKIETGHIVRINFNTGEIENKTTGKKGSVNPFSDVQEEIYLKGGLLSK